MKKTTTRKTKTRKPKDSSSHAPHCGLCGKRGRLIQTDCCGQWICDDEENYVLFSYARNSCHRNHSRYTLCAFHHNEGHAGDWRTCKKCRESFPTEIYVGYGTNEYNFVKLENPPAYEPTRCDGCGVVIKLSEGGYSQGRDGIFCEKCTRKKFPISKLD
jgi:hypothetical protein